MHDGLREMVLAAWYGGSLLLFLGTGVGGCMDMIPVEI